MHVVREATEGDGEGREERKRHDVDGARHGERGKEEAKELQRPPFVYNRRRMQL
jgi:hypothetical protein